MSLPDETFQSLVLVLEERGEPTWVGAFPAESELIRTPEVEPGDDKGLALEALLLPQSLEALAIEPGRIASDPEGYCLPLDGATVRRAEIWPDQIPTWFDVAAPSAGTRSFRRAAVPEPCAFDVKGALQLPTGEPANILLGHADGERLVAGTTQGLFVLNLAGDILHQEAGLWCAGRNIEGTARFILARCAGAVFELDLDRSPIALRELFRLEELGTDERDLVMIGAQEVAGSLEVFMLSRSGLVLRRTEASGVERLHQFDRSMTTANYLGGLVVLGPGHALAGVESNSALLEYEGGATRLVEFGSDSGVSTLHASEYGLMIGTTTGAMWHRAPGQTEFILLPDSPNRSWVVAFEALEGGDYLYALTFGAIGLWEVGRGFCGPEVISAQSHRRLARLGTSYAVTGQNTGLARTPITIFDVEKSGRSLTRDCSP